MNREPGFREECVTLCQFLSRHPTLEALRAASDWRDYESRLARVLGTVRRYRPEAPPAPPTSEERVLAVHWNIEHGNWYEQVEAALTSHPLLQAADLMLFNEIDFGMARAGNRDVTGDLARALNLYGCWAPLFLETTLGRDDDPRMAAGRENNEGLFGLGILSRWPIGAAKIVELPTAGRYQFDVERMYGRHIALVAEIERPGAPFVAVSIHLEVHLTRADRARQMQALVTALASEKRPVILAGDFNSHTLDRGRPWDILINGLVMLTWSHRALLERFLYPDRGPAHETVFDVLRDADFEWNRFNDRKPTLRVRYDRIEEARALIRLAGPLIRRAELRSRLRLDWFAGRGWREGRGATVSGLDGPGKAADHAPIVAEFR